MLMMTVRRTPGDKRTAWVSGLGAAGRLRLFWTMVVALRMLAPQGQAVTAAWPWIPQSTHLKSLDTTLLLRTYLVGIDVAGGPHGYDVGVVGEHGKEHRAVVLP